MKIRRLEEVLKEFPDFKPGWKINGYKMENPRFGSVELIAVCNDKGEPLWDQPQIREQPGSIIIPYYEGGYYSNDYRLGTKRYVGIIKRIREVIIDPVNGEQGKVVSLEFPRGFAKGDEPLIETAKRELSEETSSVIKMVSLLGSINPLTSHYTDQKANEVFAALIDYDETKRLRSKGLSKKAEKEGILSAEYLLTDEVDSLIDENEIVCGLTKAAFANFKAHAYTVLMRRNL